MRVCNREAGRCSSAYCFGVAIYVTDFFHRVGNVLSVLLLVKVIPRVRPVVAFAQRCSFSLYCSSVCIQLYLYVPRTLSVLVVAILPRLRDRDARLSRRIAVRDVVATDHCRVIFNRILRHRIDNLCSVCILRQILKAV